MFKIKALVLKKFEVSIKVIKMNSFNLIFESLCAITSCIHWSLEGFKSIYNFGLIRAGQCQRILLSSTNIQIHDFCDASEEAYGAYTYVRTRNNECFSCRLLCSKSLKKLMLPRLGHVQHIYSRKCRQSLYIKLVFIFMI